MSAEKYHNVNKKILYKNRNLQKVKKTFQNYGLIIFKKVAKNQDIDNVYKTIFFLYNKYSKNKIRKYDRKELLKSLIKIRKTNKSIFSKIYDDLQVSSSVYKLLHSEEIFDIGRSLLGQKKYSPIGVSGTMLRLDPPNDRRNLYDWHQDHSYYRQNKSGKNGLVISVALHNIDKKKGALKVALKSHNLGFLKVRTKRKSFNSSQQYSMKLSKIKKYILARQIMNKGDVSAIYLDTAHCSADNTSSELRITGLVRVHSIMSNDFRHYRDNSEFIDEIKKKKKIVFY